jgi:hypothetical protein
MIIVGGLAAYSFYFQQDEFTATVEEVTIKEVTTSDQSCLERWDYLRLVNQETRDYKVIADNLKLNMEFFKPDGCADSFRDWMSKTNSDWDLFDYLEINKKERCELYLKGELEMEEWIKPVMREMGCEDLLKQ